MAQTRLFDKYIKSNILHKSKYDSDSRLKIIVIEHTVYYRRHSVLDDNRSRELHAEIINFFDRGNTVKETLSYRGYIEELYQLAKKIDHIGDYTNDVNMLRICADNYYKLTQIAKRNETLQSKLDKLNNTRANYNADKLIKDYASADDKEAFKHNQRYINVTPYNWIELDKIKDKTGITTNSNMIFDENYVADDLMGTINDLKNDIRDFNSSYQEMKLSDLDNNSASQLFNTAEGELDLDKHLSDTLTHLAVTKDLLDGGNFNPQNGLDLAHTKRLVNDTAFIRASTAVYKNADNSVKQVTGLNNSLTRGNTVLGEFKSQKDLYRDNQAIDKSMQDWFNQDPMNLNGFDRNNLQNLPGSLKYLQDLYGRTTSEFDPNFRDRVIAGIGAITALLATVLNLLQGTLDGIMNLLQSLLNLCGSIIQGIINLLLNILQAIKCLIKAALCAIGQILNTVLDALDKVIPFLKNLTGLANKTEDLKLLPGKLTNKVTKLADEAVKEIFNQVNANVDKVYGQISGALGADTANSFKKAMSHASVLCQANANASIVDELLGRATSLFSSLVDEGVDTLKNSRSQCPSLLGNLPSFNFNINSDFRLKRISFPDLNMRMGGC